MIIEGRNIGVGYPCYVIAEMSANHHKDLGKARAIIRAAKEAGADAVKIQTYTADTLTIDCDNEYFRLGKHKLWGGKTLYQLYEEACMPWEWHGKLKKQAEDLEIALFSTAYDESSVDFLEELEVGAYKIASFELVDIPLLEKVARTGKPVMISTGMATLDEIKLAFQTLRDNGAGPICLLKCVSGYPTDPADMNLLTIPDLKKTFKTIIGLSDHTLETSIPVAAISLGANVIEKHFTLSRSDMGPDSSFSMEPAEFRQMVHDIRIGEKALGRVFYGRTACEEESTKFRRSIFSVKDIEKGEILTQENVRIIRPGVGLAPFHYNEILGKKATANVLRGIPIAWDLVEDA